MAKPNETWRRVAERGHRVEDSPGGVTTIGLIARRKSPEAAAAAIQLPHQKASRKQHRIDPRSLIAAEYVILATSLDAAAFPDTEVLAVYRLRLRSNWRSSG